MEIGPFIKLHRIKQNMTQEELADGIVSESYLSKIENQKTDASQEVIDMLCVRLGVQYKCEEDSIVKEKCEEWFNLLFENNSRELLNTKYEELEDLINNTDSDYEILFEIHKIRYYLVLGEDKLALKQIGKLKEFANNFDDFKQYFWLKFNGNYNSVIEEYNQAMRYYKLAEDLLPSIELMEVESADLKYTVAVTYSKLRNTLETIDYSTQALSIYRNNYNFLRCAQCHILLGISYRRIRVYDKAIKNYNLARHLAELNKDKKLIQLTNQNLGYLHSSKGETEQAIHYFKSALDDEEIVVENKLITLTSLISEYYISYNFDEAKKLVYEGIKIINKVDIDRYKLFNYELKAYKYTLENETEKFESLVVGEFIPFLQKQKDYANLVKYANMAGKFYEKAKKYKEAVKHFKLANLSYEQLINI
jgi:tetratricopeptide (TPR) repeat protein